MALPLETYYWVESIDPSDIVEYVLDCSGLLEEGENVASYTLQATVEATLLGFSFGSDNYKTARIKNVILFWPMMANPSSLAYMPGVVVPLELTINTDHNPPRRKQRTVAFKVIQK